MWSKSKTFLFVLLFCSVLVAKGPRRSSQVYVPGQRTDFYLAESGEASWYGPGFHGKVTASGKVFNTHYYTMAHKTLPLGEVVCVRNVRNGAVVVAQVTDRGPYIKGRIADLSLQAMRKLGLVAQGHGMVQIYRTRDAIAVR